MIGLVPLLTVLFIDSVDPFDAVEPFVFGVDGPTCLALELCAKRGDNGELIVLLELF